MVGCSAMRLSPVLQALAVVTLLSSCGWSVDTAREAAAQHSCNYYDKCGDIHTGKTYATRDECLTKQRAYWLDAWPTSTCGGKINGPNTDSCITAIDNTQCNNGLDYLATLSKCGANSVCK